MGLGKLPNPRQKVENVDLLSRWGTRLRLVITLDWALPHTKKEFTRWEVSQEPSILSQK